MCRRLVKPFFGMSTRLILGARETRDHACPAVQAGPGRHPGHPVAVEGLPVSGPGPMTTGAGEPALWALTIVTVHASLGGLREAVKKADGRSQLVARTLTFPRLPAYLSRTT